MALMMVCSVRVCSVARFALQVNADQHDKLYTPSQATLQNNVQKYSWKIFLVYSLLHFLTLILLTWRIG